MLLLELLELAVRCGGISFEVLEVVLQRCLIIFKVFFRISTVCSNLKWVSNPV
jgi:hypothetical protein